MDKLKRYIEQNRSAFDVHEPSAGLWQKIEMQMSEGKVPIKPSVMPKSFRILRMAASVILLLSLGYVLGKYSNPIKENTGILTLSPKYGSQLVKFSSNIEAKKEQLQEYLEVDPSLLKPFSQDLQPLAESYLELKNELPNNPNQEEILQKMIENLQWQMELLDQQIKVIKEVKTQKEKSVLVLVPFSKNNFYI